MASPTVSEPQFLAARRERAAALTETLELPSFKGVPGWEFTDISAIDIDAFEPASGRDADALTGVSGSKVDRLEILLLVNVHNEISHD